MPLNTSFWYLTLCDTIRVTIIAIRNGKMYTKRKSKQGKTIAILDAVHRAEAYGKRSSIYAIAKAAGYTPNGSFSQSVWDCVDSGLLDARPAGTAGGRYAWQLSLTSAGWVHLKKETKWGVE